MALSDFITNRMNDTGGYSLVSDVELRICGDPTGGDQNIVLGGALDAIARDSTAINRIIWAGYSNADGTTRAEVTIDANGGAFKVLNPVTADYHIFIDIHCTNTNRASGNDGWHFDSGADYCTLIRCRGSWASYGIYAHTTARFLTVIDCRGHNNVLRGISAGSSDHMLLGCVGHNNGNVGLAGGGGCTRCIAYDNADVGIYANHVAECAAYNNLTGFQSASNFFVGDFRDCISVGNAAYGYRVLGTGATMYLLRCAGYDNTSGRLSSEFVGTWLADDDDPGISANPFVEAAPKYVLAAGASGATASDNGAASNIEDLDNGGWGGSVQIGDRIRFFENSTDVEDAIESVVTAINVGADADVITVSPQVTAGAQKQCWLGGGNFALNNEENGGAKCRNTTGRATLDGWSTDYLDIGAVQHQAVAGRTIYSIG
jgi:hypothetical protein